MSSPRQQLHEIGEKVIRRLADDIVTEIRDNPRTPEEETRHRRGGPHLRDSFRVVAKGDGYDIVSDVDYWAYVEYGHRTRPSHHPGRGGHVQHWVHAQPYLRPAIRIALDRLRGET